MSQVNEILSLLVEKSDSLGAAPELLFGPSSLSLGVHLLLNRGPAAPPPRAAVGKVRQFLAPFCLFLMGQLEAWLSGFRSLCLWRSLVSNRGVCIRAWSLALGLGLWGRPCLFASPQWGKWGILARGAEEVKRGG